MDNLFSPLNLLVATTAITVLPHSKPRFQKIWPYPVIALIGSAIAAIFLWANGQLNYRFLNVSAFIPVYLIAGSAIVYTINNYLVVKKNNLPSIPLIVFSVSVFWIGFASIQSNSASRHSYKMGELNERKNALSSSEKILNESEALSELERSKLMLGISCAISKKDYGVPMEECAHVLTLDETGFLQYVIKQLDTLSDEKVSEKHINDKQLLGDVLR